MAQTTTTFDVDGTEVKVTTNGDLIRVALGRDGIDASLTFTADQAEELGIFLAEAVIGIKGSVTHSRPRPQLYSYTVCEDRKNDGEFAVHSSFCGDLNRGDREWGEVFEAEDAQDAIAMAVTSSIEDGDPDAGAYASNPDFYRVLPCVTK